MKRNIIRTFILILFIASSSASGQKSFPASGIYYTFESFCKGVPDLKAEMLYKDFKTKTPASGIRQWFNLEKKWYQAGVDSVAELGEVPVWGFYENGTAYILLKGKFHKILLLGQISYFLESYPILKDNMSPVVTEARSESVYRLLDMKTGKIGTYEPGRLEMLMKDDEALYTEFHTINSAKTKSRKMYSFMERYNKAHPLLPLN